MRQLLLIWVTIISFSTNAQTTAFAETFESGNSLILVNGTQTNKWFRGSANQCNGVSALYISNNSSAYSYTNTSAASTVHAYFDVAIPAGATTIQLSFNRKVAGEITSGILYDYLQIWSCINTFTPTAGTLITANSNRVSLGTIQGQTTCATTTYSLPNSIAGTTRRIIFSWRNDNSGGGNPPALIDNISVTYVTPCTTPTTAGTLSANKPSTTVNDAVVFTTTGNAGTITKFEWSYNNFSAIAGTVNNPTNPYTLILNVQQPTMWFRTTSVSSTCPAGVTVPISVTLQSAPEYVYGTEDGDYISNVTLNTINNNSTYDSPLGDGYQDFTSISTTLVKGANYTISVSSPVTFLGSASGYAAWIDFDNDGLFETTETIMQQAAGATRSQSFTVPSTTATALVTMRVLSSWNETPSTDAYYSAGYDWGEIEEYKINITSALPAELYMFDGKSIGSHNYLFWSTISEQNTSHFNLQKSRDGETWTTITTLNAAGNSTTNIDYNVTDYEVEPIINYYRLQQYDSNGVYETYGPVVINNMDSDIVKYVIMFLNLHGQQIDPTALPATGIYIEVYNDGTMKKVYR